MYSGNEPDERNTERWSGRVALITGTSSGIGAAIAKALVKRGLKVVGVARRVERVEDLANELKNEKGKLYALKADVSKEEDILATFDWIKKNLGGVDILVNNAAVAGSVPLTDGTTERFQHMFNLNVVGLSICTREAIKSMRERGVDDGHIIHINSILGHQIYNFPGSFAYTAAKHAVTVLTEGLRRELVMQKSKIRVSSISPGAVDTEMYREAMERLPPGFEMAALYPEDLADAALFVLGAPPHVQVHELTLAHVEV